MSKHRGQIKIGITGCIGSGKTFVSTIFSKLGIPVFNADFEAKKCMSEVDFLKNEIQNLFGDHVYKKGVLQKKVLANIVFNDSKMLDRLNKLVHPVVKQYFIDWCGKQNSEIVVKEAAILFETNSHIGLDKVICISAPEKIRIKRVVQRDNCSSMEVRSRMAKQFSQSKKESYSDFIIINDGVKLIVPQIIKSFKNLGLMYEF